MDPHVSGGGAHDHRILLSYSEVANAIASGSGSIPESVVTNPWNNPNATGEGTAYGLKSPADGHSHGTGGQVTLDNRSHTHSISDITPPWRNTTFIIKM
jgi:poly(3-hydroxybutyrate) depolymerase